MSLALLGFAVADLLRWSPGAVSVTRTVLSLAGATTVTVVVAGLSGFQPQAVALVGVIMFVVLAVWLLPGQPRFQSYGPGYQLAWILVVLLAAFVKDRENSPVATMGIPHLVGAL